MEGTGGEADISEGIMRLCFINKIFFVFHRLFFHCSIVTHKHILHQPFLLLIAMENVYLEVFVKEPTVLVDLTENVEIRNDSLILRKLD